MSVSCKGESSAQPFRQGAAWSVRQVSLVTVDVQCVRSLQDSKRKFYLEVRGDRELDSM